MTKFCGKCCASGGKMNNKGEWVDCSRCYGTGIIEWSDPANE